MSGSVKAKSAGGLWPLLFLFGAALAPRLLYLAQTSHLPYFADFFLDGDWYRQRANEALSGQWLSSESHFRGPLYPWFLAEVFRLFGESPHPVRVIQLVLGAANAPLLWAVARRFVTPLGALLAALLYAGYGTLVYFDGEILTLTLETTLLLLFLLAVTNRSLGGAVWAGVLLGASAILRPSILPLALPALLFLRGNDRPWRDEGIRPRRFAPMLFFACFALPILAVVVGYRAILHDWIPISSQGGINFYLGNHEGADGSAAIAPCTGDLDLVVGDRYRDTVGECSRRVAERITGHPLTPSQVSGYWTRRGLEFARAHPGEFSLLFLKRLYLVVSDQELDNNQNVPYFLEHHAPWIPAMPVRAGLIVALGVPGMIWLARRSREGRMLVAAALLLTAFTACFLVMSRYRVPVLLLVLPYAGEWLARIGRDARARAWRRFAWGLGASVLIAAFSMAGLHRAGSDAVRAAQAFTMGYAEERAGNLDAAAAMYRRSLDFDPSFNQVRYTLGNTLARLARGGEAMKEFDTLLAADPRYAPFVANTRGIIALDAGDVDGAIAAFRQALAGDPAPTTHANLGVALLAAGRAAEALPELEIAWGSGTVSPEVGVDLARARLDVGDTLRAEADLTALLAREPGLVRGWMLLAQNRQARGDLAGEVEALRAALRAEPGLAEAATRLRELER